MFENITHNQKSSGGIARTSVVLERPV